MQTTAHVTHYRVRDLALLERAISKTMVAQPDGSTRPMSYRSLAAMTSVGKSTIGKIVSGKQRDVGSALAVEIAHAIDLSLDFIFCPVSSTVTRDVPPQGAA